MEKLNEGCNTALLNEELQRVLTKLKSKLKNEGCDEKFIEMFSKCFMNTAETTVRYTDSGEVFLITGDIEAMWLRDSSAQVVHYLPFARESRIIADMIKGLIFRQFRYINMDTYANAFNEGATGSRWNRDLTEMTPWEWERKYEIDSLCYPIKLLSDYYTNTGDETVFTPEVYSGIKKIIDTWTREQDHFEKSNYSFTRLNCRQTDTLANDGKGAPVVHTGMTWSGFRPSDDACVYGYLIPSNLFASAVLKNAAYFAGHKFNDMELMRRAAELKKEIDEGIAGYGIINDEKFGEIYAYETDGQGNYLFMDDANVPSLVSLPWLGVCDKNDERYLRTRKAALSERNPFYFEGSAAKGIGSPHTPDRYIWHIALCMQGLTSDDEHERRELLDTLVRTDARTGFMHEGFNCDRPEEFTRSWFAWANSLFALFVMDFYKLMK